MTKHPRPLNQATLSVVIPAYNEQANISGFIDEIYTRLLPLVKKLDIIIVDDGSRDDTCTIVTNQSKTIPLRLLKLSRNFGKEHALTAGIAHAGGDCVLLIDADFQHPISTAINMLHAWSDGIDMVYGIRKDRSDEGMLKRLGTTMFYRLVQGGSEVVIPRDAGDFRLMDQRVVAALNALPERNRFMKGLYAWVGFSQLAVQFEVQARAAGNTTFSVRKLISLALTGLTAFSMRPLRWIAGLGAVVAVFAVLFAAYILLEYLSVGQTIAGFSTLVVSITFFSGVQLFCIGVLGEYLGRIYTEVKARPLYLLDSVLDSRMAQPNAGSPNNTFSA
jgi:polyisoprenyl-phosphate glycosyltransferase